MPPAQVGLESDGADGSRHVIVAEPETVSRSRYRRAQPNSPRLAAQPLRWVLVPATSDSEFKVNSANVHGGTNFRVEELRARRAKVKACRSAGSKSHYGASDNPAKDKGVDVVCARITAKRQARATHAIAREQPWVVRALAGLPPKEGGEDAGAASDTYNSV